MVETKSQVKHTQSALKVMEFNEINDPGCYVILDTGSLVRVPREAIAPGRSPLITFRRRGSMRVAQLSTNTAELISTLRYIASNNDIQPNF